MKNFPIIDKETGREYWISRSVAVLGIVKAIDKNGVKYILAEQRGTGTPDSEYIGKWCLPCGYLDFDETCKQAVAREVREETGINIHPENFELIAINDNPFDDKRQNITFRFRTELEGYIDDFELTDKFSETDEVMNIKWIDLREIDNFKWAFNHEKIIKKYYR
jgi:ADP-ribose pyrophosphatase YjhB (NUDIX family)